METPKVPSSTEALGNLIIMAVLAYAGFATIMDFGAKSVFTNMANGLYWGFVFVVLLIIISLISRFHAYVRGLIIRAVGEWEYRLITRTVIWYTVIQSSISLYKLGYRPRDVYSFAFDVIISFLSFIGP